VSAASGPFRHERVVDGRAALLRSAGAANGGYLAGRLATIVGGPSEVRFRRPTPLERPVRVDRVAGRIVLVHRDLVTAYGRSIENRVLMVGFTLRGRRIRVVTARPASRKERKIHEG
jgi:hypothetical protein